MRVANMKTVDYQNDAKLTRSRSDSFPTWLKRVRCWLFG